MSDALSDEASPDIGHAHRTGGGQIHQLIAFGPPGGVLRIKRTPGIFPQNYFAMIEEALTQPTNLKMLKIDGKRVMEVTRETPGRRIGLILNALMGEVLETPEMNTEEILATRSTELAKLSDKELVDLAKKGEELVEEEQEDTKKQIRNAQIFIKLPTIQK